MMSQKIKFNCLKFSLVAGFMLFLQAGFAQGRFADLESTIDARKSMLGNDLIVVVANKDTVLYQKTFGDMTLRTQEYVGAASAWFTTALILQLVDEGKLSLDDKVAQYIPVFGSYAKNYVTIRHCLTHMTGIRTDAFKTASLTNRKSYESLEAEVADFAKKEIQTNAGEEFRYTSMGATIAGRIAEVVTKKKFEQLMRQRIFAPLGMRNTAFSTDDGTPASPSIGAKTTGVDFARFLQMILAGGSFGGKKILSPEAIAEMRKIQFAAERIKNAPKQMEGLSYTLGVWSADLVEEPGAKANVLVSPGLLGTWPMVNFEKGYAFVIVSKQLKGEQRQNEYMGLKEILDELPPAAFKK